jgi:hypothetical protein
MVVKSSEVMPRLELIEAVLQRMHIDVNVDQLPIMVRLQSREDAITHFHNMAAQWFGNASAMEQIGDVLKLAEVFTTDLQDVATVVPKEVADLKSRITLLEQRPESRCRERGPALAKPAQACTYPASAANPKDQQPVQDKRMLARSASPPTKQNLASSPPLVSKQHLSSPPPQVAKASHSPIGSQALQDTGNNGQLTKQPASPSSVPIPLGSMRAGHFVDVGTVRRMQSRDFVQRGTSSSPKHERPSSALPSPIIMPNRSAGRFPAETADDIRGPSMRMTQNAAGSSISSAAQKPNCTMNVDAHALAMTTEKPFATPLNVPRSATVRMRASRPQGSPEARRKTVGSPQGAPQAKTSPIEFQAKS